MLEIHEKDFKAAIIKKFQGVSMSTLEINGKVKFQQEIEIINKIKWKFYSLPGKYESQFKKKVDLIR